MNKSFAFSSSLFCLSFLIGLSFSCKKPTEPDTNTGFGISVEDVSCIEAWVRVKSLGMPLPADIVITKNDTPAFTFTMSNTDTVVMIDSLLPKQTYTFRAFRSDKTKAMATAECMTMDTTSHNFAWQTFSFGEHSSSVLYDVAVIDENNIWAVGEIYMKDSIGGVDPYAFNLAYFNGKSWKLNRVYYDYRGSQLLAPLRSVSARSILSLWVGSNQPMLMQNDAWTKWDLGSNLWDGWINKIENLSNGCAYIIGGKGNIAFFDGANWAKVMSNTNTDIHDILGVIDSEKNKHLILCAVSNVAEPGDKKLLQINNDLSITERPWIQGKRIHSIWMNNIYKIIACGDGVFFGDLYGNWVQQNPLRPYFKMRVRGSANNNIFVVGGYGFLAHYNGQSWREYPEAGTALIYNSVAVKDKITVAVGLTEKKAIIQIFRQQ